MNTPHQLANQQAHTVVTFKAILNKATSALELREGGGAVARATEALRVTLRRFTEAELSAWRKWAEPDVGEVIGKECSTELSRRIAKRNVAGSANATDRGDNGAPAHYRNGGRR